MRKRWTTRSIYVSIYGTLVTFRTSQFWDVELREWKGIYIMCLNKFEHDRKYNKRYIYRPVIPFFNYQALMAVVPTERKYRCRRLYCLDTDYRAGRRDHEREHKLRLNGESFGMALLYILICNFVIFL